MTLTQEQLQQRRHGVGASEVAAVLGLNEFRSALDVFMEKTGVVESTGEDPNEAAEWGNRLESEVARAYADKIGEPVTLRTSFTLTHPRFTWALATPDRIVTSADSRWLLEIKCRSWSTAKGFGTPGTDQVPDDVLCQAQWQMCVTGDLRCDIALLIDGREFRIYRIERDLELHAQMLHQVGEFWRLHVLRDVPPPVVAKDNESIKLLFPKNLRPMMPVVGPEGATLLDELRQARARFDSASEQKDAVEAAVKVFLGDYEGAEANGMRVTWKNNKDSLKTNWQAVAEVVRRHPGADSSSHGRRARGARAAIHGGQVTMSAPQFSTEVPPDEYPEPGALVTVPPAALPAVVETSSTSVAARERASVEARFLVAMRTPRSMDAARLRLLDACKRPRFAEGARYLKPVGTKKVEGLSVRFAEECFRLWGNLALDVLLVFDDDERRIYRVSGCDLETNATSSQDVILEKFVERRSLKQGEQFISKRINSTGETTFKIAATEDALLNKVNAAISKARRNIILALIPSDIREECEEAIISTMAKRDADDPDAERKKVLQSFWTLGVGPEKIEELLGTELVKIRPAQLTLLRSCYTALREGEATWDQILESFGKEAQGTKHSTAGLKERLTKKAAKAEKAPQTDLEIDQEIVDAEGGA